MIPLIIWGTYEAWKLLQPVAQRIVADADQGMATWTEKKATGWLKRTITPAVAVARPPRPTVPVRRMKWPVRRMRRSLRH